MYFIYFGFQHTKGHVLHKQFLHYSIGSRILSLSYYILLLIFRIQVPLQHLIRTVELSVIMFSFTSKSAIAEAFQVCACPASLLV